MFYCLMASAFIVALNFGLFVSTGFTGAVTGGCFVFTLLLFIFNLVNFFKYGDKE